MTALFCYNGSVAIGALPAYADLDRRVLDDLGLVGFDDIPLAALVTPPLTTCRVPRSKLGVQAMHLLMNQIGGDMDECEEAVLQTELSFVAAPRSRGVCVS